MLTVIAPTSFCKCTCFNNSTIITLDPSPSSSESISRFLWTRADPKGGGDGKKPQRQGNCNDCNKQFCLDYNLPICKKAMEKDVVTTCFRMSPFSWLFRDIPVDSLKLTSIERDSSKDQVVVFIFIFATIGLLGWALIRPWVDNWIEVWNSFHDIEQTC